MDKKTFKQFLIEKKAKTEKECIDLNDLDCSSDDLTEEEQELCNKKFILDLIKKSKIVNN